jgi:hypothetical protein
MICFGQTLAPTMAAFWPAIKIVFGVVTVEFFPFLLDKRVMSREGLPGQ